MDKQFITPIAFVKSDFKEKFGIPRQSGRAPSNISEIVFLKEFSDINAFREIESFSHLWIIFDFSKAHKDVFTPLVRPPRLGGNKKVGVFASRSPFRPNNIGLSSVKLISVNTLSDGCISLTVGGADLLDGTPVYDVKPYLPFTDCHTDAIGGYADNQVDYKLNLNLPDNICSYFTKEQLSALKECLEDDPRPSYQEDGKSYGMRFSDYNIKFTVKEKTLTVLEIEKV